MKRLIESGTYNRGRRPSGHVVREGFTEDRGGAIPPNLLAISNTGNDKEYLDSCREHGLRPHPARFPAELPDFFINLLTEPEDLVVDPFAGSNVTGAVAEALGRRWLSIDIDDEYLRGSAARFEAISSSQISSSRRRSGCMCRVDAKQRCARSPDPAGQRARRDALRCNTLRAPGCYPSSAPDLRQLPEGNAGGGAERARRRSYAGRHRSSRTVESQS